MNMTNPTTSPSSGFIGYISGVAALGGLLFGFDTAIISGAIPAIRSYFALDSLSLGWAVSSILIGCAFGAASAGKLADRFGRKSMMLLCALLFAVSGLGAGLSESLSFFIGYRIVGGLGVGAAAMICPMYIAELAPSAIRGKVMPPVMRAIRSRGRHRSGRRRSVVPGTPSRPRWSGTG